MPNIAERLQELFPGPRARRKLQDSVATLTDLIQKEPWRVRELDQQLVDNLLRHFNDVRLSNIDVGTTLSEQDRIAIVNQSRLLYITDPLAQRMIGLWTDFAWGMGPKVSLKDEDAQETWSAFWDDKMNQAVLKPRRQHLLSDKILTDGEFYFVFFVNTSTGYVRLRVIPTEQITEIVVDPNDEDTHLYYRRDWTPNAPNAQQQTRYYPCWNAGPQDLERAPLPEGSQIAEAVSKRGTVTKALMMQVSHRPFNQRGWPLLSAGIEWVRAYRNFLQDRAAVARAVATFVDELTVKGGSRAVDTVRRTLESALANAGSVFDTNPAPAAGSTDIHNEAITRNRLPLSSGAGDAQSDGAMIIAQAGLAGGLYPHYLGRGEAFRLATAAAMDLPVKKQFQRYAAFWADVFTDVVHLVLDMAEEYGGKKFEEEQREVDISTAVLSDVDLPALSAAVAQLQPLVQMPPEVWTQLVLQAFNIPDADTIMLKLYPTEPEVPEEIPVEPEPASGEPEEGPAEPEEPPVETQPTVEVVAKLEELLEKALMVSVEDDDVHNDAG